jgi:hypothetical protein
VFAQDTTINGSDLNQKKNISEPSEKYETFFNKLKTIRYKWIINDSDRYHIGFGAQNVRDNLL